MITPAQCIEARRLFGWTRDDLSAPSSASHAMIWRFEVADKVPLNSWFIESIELALEEAGVEFTNRGEPGVKLRAKGS